MTFDARKAKLLAPGEHIIIEHCLGLRLTASSAGRAWIYRFKSPIDGRMRQIKLGQWPAMSLMVAMSEWERLRQVRERGGDPAQEKKTVRAVVKAQAEQLRLEKKNAVYTVRRLCDDYLDGHIARNRNPKGEKEVRRLLARMIDLIADVPAASLTRAQAFDQLDTHLDTPVLCLQLRAELGAAWDYALDAGRLTDNTPNWWRMLMRGKIKSKGKQIDGEKIGTVKRVLSEPDLVQLIPWLPNFQPAIADVLTLYLWTGSRGAEIVAMEAAEITQEGDGWWWTIPKRKTKNARHENATDQRVALSGRAEEVVLRRLAQTPKGFLFPSASKNGHLEQKYISEQVYYYQPYCKVREELVRKRLPVSHWAPHDLRRTARTMLAALDCPDSVAEAIIGHMQNGIKGVYNRHSYDKQRREWLTRLAEHLESLV
jgi:integrase